MPVPAWEGSPIECTKRTVGGRKGWRLPSVHELASLVDPSVVASGPTLPPGHPFSDVQTSSPYWSGTSDADTPTDAWLVGFASGGVGTNRKPPTTISFLWCARGGMNADAY